MRVAIPVSNGKSGAVFSTCDGLVLIDVDDQMRSIVGREDVAPPSVDPETLPQWFAARGVRLVIAGHTDPRIQLKLRQSGLVVVAGVPALDPEQLINSFLLRSLSGDAKA